MGEAKRRGSQSQRATEAQQRKAVSVAQIKEEFNVPPEAEFVGFVVWLKNRDEFLVKIVEEAGITKRLYGGDVDRAIHFDTFEAAEPHAKASKHPAIVAVAFDLDNRVFIVG